jgi:hypothetical protein
MYEMCGHQNNNAKGIALAYITHDSQCISDGDLFQKSVLECLL